MISSLPTFLNNGWVLLVLYCASQTAVLLLLKLAAVRPSVFWPVFLAANALTATGIWLFTLALRQINPNIATAVGMGGTFVAGQLLLAWLFQSRLSVPQMGGVALIFIGLMVLTTQHR
jgi:multidrug transporter EmrE-like cation transporter